ncbi:hypothetical protein NL676_037282 [Syzygium grande]|nr:hypothetical protein NL676_037282 [Syzygium grande]
MVRVVKRVAVVLGGGTGSGGDGTGGGTWEMAGRRLAGRRGRATAPGGQGAAPAFNTGAAAGTGRAGG